MRARSLKWRKFNDGLIKAISLSASMIGIVALGFILFEVLNRGMSAFDISFFTELPTPPGMEGGGLANAIVGTLAITALAAFLGVPTGVMAGVYLAEFSQQGRLGSMVRFAVNVMIGMPSIIVGLFVYTIIVLPLGHFSGYAGAVSLAIIIFPIVARTTEDMLNMIPSALRESALALGAPRWKVILGVVFKAARGGLLTGILLSVARVSGETAPLLLTALNSPFWNHSLNEPTANLTVTIFNYAMSPYADWQQKAWGASLLIMVAILTLTVFARIFLRERKAR